MKGIIRIAGFEYRGFSYVYWNLFVVREIQKRVKKEIGSTAITSFHVFFKICRDRYRVDYLIVSCPSSLWDKLKEELEWRYVCVDPTFKFNKKKQSWVRTEVSFYREDELKGELLDHPVLIVSGHVENSGAEFEIRWEGDEGECPYYKPYERFTVDQEGKYEKNLEAGTLILESERKWKRDGGEKKWRKRKAWKTVGGNYKEVK
jgi:hypothetical protein